MALTIDTETIIVFATVVPSVILHEVSHGVVAYAFGDATAKRAGRLSLNPLRHIDPFGTILLPLMLALAGGPAFGYAKPVPVNVQRLRNPRRHTLFVSLAGPFTNICIAVAAALALHVMGTAHTMTTGDPYHLQGTASDAVFTLGVVNVILAAFNLIPIPPLDGSAFIERLLPHQWWPNWLKFRQYSMLLLFGVMLLGRDKLFYVFNPALHLWGKLLG